MNRSSKGLVLLFLGLGAMAFAVWLVWSGFSGFMTAFRPMTVFEGPGEGRITLTEAGTITLWHDHQTVFGGRSVNHPKALSGTWTFTVAPAAGGPPLTLSGAASTTTMSSGSTSRIALASAQLDHPGDYVVSVQQTGAEPRIFSVTEGSGFGQIVGGMGKFFGAVFASLIGVVLMIVGVILMILKKDPKRLPATPPPMR